jgi:hypothetical protein
LPVAADGCRLHHGRSPINETPAYSGEGTDHGSTARALALGSMLGTMAFGSGALAQNGSQVDLTGTWEGAQIWDDLIGGEFADFVVVDNLLLVVQDGDRFRFVFIGDQEDIADDLVYEGVIQTVEGSEHFEALAGICGGDYKAEELVRLRRIATSADGGRFDAESIFFTDDFPLAEGVLDFQTCKWAYNNDRYVSG